MSASQNPISPKFAKKSMGYESDSLNLRGYERFPTVLLVSCVRGLE